MARKSRVVVDLSDQLRHENEQLKKEIYHWRLRHLKMTGTLEQIVGIPIFGHINPRESLLTAKRLAQQAIERDAETLS